MARSHLAIFLIIFCICCIPQASWADLHLLYFGGAEERGDLDNQFDPDFEALVKLSAKKKWRAEFQTDLGHPATMKLIEKLRPELAGATLSDFTQNNIRNRLGSLYKEMSNAKKYREGDQILLVISTHGIFYEKDLTLVIHTVDGLMGPTYLLRDLVTEAARRKIRLALAIQTCYSGNLIKLFQNQLAGNPSVCLITASSFKRISFSPSNVFETLGEVPTLEDAFLISRRKVTSIPYQPMIATPAGLMAARDLDFFRNHILYSPIDDGAARADRLCTNTQAVLDRLHAAVNEAEPYGPKSLAFAWLKSKPRVTAAVEDLIKTQLEKEASFENEMERVRTESFYGLDYDHCLTKKIRPTVISAVKMANQEQFCQAFFPKPIDKINAKPERWSDVDPVVRKLRNIIARDQEIFKEAKEARDSLWSNPALIEKERQVYDLLYQHYFRMTQDQPNPCRSFEL